jgi:hypothetical protein
MMDYVDIAVSLIAVVFCVWLIMQTVKEIKDDTR